MDDAATLPPAGVLIVDDSPENLRLLGGLLSERGYSVRLLPEGRLALRSAQASPPDAVLLDIRLPDMDGFAICEALKADVRTRDVPVIFCSGLDATFDKVRAFAAGGVDYVTKPFDAEEVLARVATHVALRRMRRQLEEQNDRLQREMAERRQAEIDLQHANRELRQRIAGLSALNQIASTLTRWSDLPAALEATGGTLARLFDHAETAIWLLAEDGTTMSRLALVAGDHTTMGGPSLVLAGDQVAGAVLRGGIPKVLAPSARPALRAQAAQLFSDAPAGSCLVLPLPARGAVIGLLCIRAASSQRMYTPAEVALAQTIASNMANAIENARLFAQAQAAAAEEERRRLARELHDSVSQALYLANLNADVLPQLWEQDQAKGRRALGDLQQFTRSALAEMRMLLVELRPSALIHTPLHELLQMLGLAMSAKHSLAVAAELDTVPLLPAEVQLSLYRIAQEAFNNVVKHAQAGRVTLGLQLTPGAPSNGSDEPCRDRIAMRIADNGCGFDMGRPASGRLGLDGMNERAAGIGATLQIRSAPHAGTDVVVDWSGSVAKGPR